jgi:hypothetical protein
LTGTPTGGPGTPTGDQGRPPGGRHAGSAARRRRRRGGPGRRRERAPPRAPPASCVSECSLAWRARSHRRVGAVARRSGCAHRHAPPGTLSGAGSSPGPRLAVLAADPARATPRASGAARRCQSPPRRAPSVAS